MSKTLGKQQNKENEMKMKLRIPVNGFEKVVTRVRTA